MKLTPATISLDDDGSSADDGKPPTVTKDGVLRYLGTSLADKSVGLPHESPKIIAHRVLHTLDHYGSREVTKVGDSLHNASGSLDVKALMPITSSMLLVGR